MHFTGFFTASNVHTNQHKIMCLYTHKQSGGRLRCHELTELVEESEDGVSSERRFCRQSAGKFDTLSWHVVLRHSSSSSSNWQQTIIISSSCHDNSSLCSSYSGFLLAVTGWSLMYRCVVQHTQIWTKVSANEKKNTSRTRTRLDLFACLATCLSA